ncbi:MAG: PhnD/SsuA/transferrin family substrate-binding protein [Pseudomonadota bacterium]|nr:MAG: PhnD/SsuA/transferrin family substrate-binding protein [Pseudomonadota bacterium]
MNTSNHRLVLILVFGLFVWTGAVGQQDEPGSDAANQAPDSAEEVVDTVEQAAAPELTEAEVSGDDEAAEDSPAETDPIDVADEAETPPPDGSATADPLIDEPAETAAAPAAREANDDNTAAGSESADIFMLQGHPIFTPDQAELVYRPLVNYLNAVLPYRFDLSIAPDFHRYWLGIRRGDTPHLVLEQAHLTAFRMSRYGYTPLARSMTPVSFSLLTSANNADASLQDFVGRRISSMPAPSLGYLVLISWFDNPMQQPIIESNASSWLDAVEIVFSMEADAAIVPNNLVERYVNMINLRTSRDFPGVTLSASPEVPVSIQEEIRDALLVLHEDPDHFSAVHELDIERFTEAREAEYEGLEEMLRLVYSTL